ncbi:hypothetical protein G7085_02330 [Tessaracoccus sp. HDW20]|nr:hypothetical protein [Tessaracoccus coleopterorum]
MGYDVSDYRAVMAEMGTLADLDELIAGCHERGMRIILDLVVNHTSDRHRWFQEAVRDPDGPTATTTSWCRAPGDATEQLDLLLLGPAWRWIPEARRWALHLFADGQMDLRWDNPAVRREVADIVAWCRTAASTASGSTSSTTSPSLTVSPTVTRSWAA